MKYNSLALFALLPPHLDGCYRIVSDQQSALFGLIVLGVVFVGAVVVANLILRLVARALHLREPWRNLVIWSGSLLVAGGVGYQLFIVWQELNVLRCFGAL